MTDTQVRAFHLGVAGYILPELRYKVLASYRESWGSAFLPALEVRDNFSYAVELNYTPERFKGWEVGLSLGQDIGDLYGNNFGAGISLKKSGKIFSR